MRKYWRRYLLVFVLVLVAAATGLFVGSGGLPLVNLYREYLSKDLPDKKFSFQDFTDRGPRIMMSGYYSGRVGDSVYIWTYSGLKRFSHQPGTSVYYAVNTCWVTQMAAEGGKVSEGVKVEPRMTYEMDEWEQGVRKGDYVWVTRVGEGTESKVIDKIWTIDSAHYPYQGLTRSVCQKR